MKKTVTLEYLKNQDYIGEFKFSYFELDADDPLEDTIELLKKWLDFVLIGSSKHYINNKSIYIKHKDLYVSILELISREGFIIFYGKGLKHVTKEEMKKIYPYDKLYTNVYNTSKKDLSKTYENTGDEW